MELELVERSSEILWLTRGIAHAYIAASKAVSRYLYDPLSHKEIDALISIYLQPKLSLSELAACRNVTKGAMSQLVSKLVSKGLVLKEQSPDSASQICLHATEAGVAFIEQFRSEFRKRDYEICEALAEQMTNEEIEAFKKGLGILSDKLLIHNLELQGLD